MIRRAVQESATQYRGKRVDVVGLGVEGSALVNFFVRRGAFVTVHHRKALPELKSGTIAERRDADFVKALARRYPERVTFVFGRSYLKNLERADYIGVVQSAFKQVYKKENKKLWQMMKRDVTTVTDVSLFLRGTTSKVIGITGTNGKTTTTELLASILKRAHADFFYGGNIGRSPLELLGKKRQPRLVVLELSNYQLEHLSQSPHIAVLLNIAPDHLEDYGGFFAKYKKAKARIFKFQRGNDIAIANADDKEAVKIVRNSHAARWSFSRARAVSRGSYLRGNSIVFKSRGRAEHILSSEDIKLGGHHNVENVLAVVTVARVLGVSRAHIKSAISHFRGKPHRLEYVRKWQGIEFYNDSKATTPASTMAAIQALSSRPLVLILGGEDKGLPFDRLARVISASVKCVLVMGRDKEKIIKALRRNGSRVPLDRADTLAQAITYAIQKAKVGDTILLSPACASFDMFQNYEHRGNEFRRVVNGL